MAKWKWEKVDKLTGTERFLKPKFPDFTGNGPGDVDTRSAQWALKRRLKILVRGEAAYRLPGKTSLFASSEPAIVSGNPCAGVLPVRCTMCFSLFDYEMRSNGRKRGEEKNLSIGSRNDSNDQQSGTDCHGAPPKPARDFADSALCYEYGQEFIY
ncbi:hypothetical protein MJG53_000583 [Ovis ammon polii x Ovis aries]|uniref:Uncharacterized protein n=1 Tax=Ovis ammon polii x Ovis aries TaxID=2918886 RepID=A0ACB9VHR7_9CETA|nr:hypothetical protein MJT46_000060 [Ovis ammon polii x Ovis aries]KAI4589534.1 hypothetical protein MJG53_000583 [Ovis ammon polii x Ovis aries]